MATLKEVKRRMHSVRSTQKITLAMKMVASAKLHRSQATVAQVRRYRYGLEELLYKLTSYGVDEAPDDAQDSAFTVQKDDSKGKIAVLTMSSNSGLAGAFNTNVIKATLNLLNKYPKERLEIYPIGKKIREALTKRDFEVEQGLDELANNIDAKRLDEITGKLMSRFAGGEVSRVYVIYHLFKSAGIQELRTETFLPFTLSAEQMQKHKDNKVGEMDSSFFEPGRETIINELIPRVLQVKMRSMLSDAHTSEHGARMVAMQLASDNADELLGELKTQYNKLRQEGITNELLDIIGSSFA